MFLAPATKNIIPDDPRPPVLEGERSDRWRDLGNVARLAGKRENTFGKFGKSIRKKSYCSSGACFGFQSSHKYNQETKSVTL